MTAQKRTRARYKRIILKLSGEAFQNRRTRLGIDPGITAKIARQIEAVRALGTEIGVVVGGGNIFRGLSGQTRGIDRNTGDYMGMLATVINALALQDALEKLAVETRVQTAIEMREVAEPFIRRRALRHLEKNRVVIFAAGTGNPYFTTDSAAALRASEIGADALLKATNVDGVYCSDPNKNPDAKLYKTVTYAEALARQLRVMDASAFALCMDNNIPIVVFNFFKPKAFERVMVGKRIGTLVCGRR
ncbi:MAG: UMP kinase [Kiritimatiellae bacterium]|nr:UMP kinase [Kiritimatiellia bacterium]